MQIKSKIFITILIQLICFQAYSQIDTEFWFAAPEAMQSHGDRPIYLRIATFSQAATVTISQPANLTFVPIILIIPASNAQSVDLTTWIDVIENKPADQVLNYGIHIESTNMITAYYEIYTSCFCNPEIFALKGDNALGMEFYTPFQNFTINGVMGAYASFDIVATENNTTVTITPNNNIVGHFGWIPYTITLNKGQTYSGTAVSQAALDHPGGSHIVSNKPIAVTVKDDSLNGAFWGGCADITGDQIVPVDIIGKKYIIMRGFLNNNIDKVFILATQNNTSIYLDGSPIPVATINTGETHQMSITNARSYIETSQPTYVLHMSGFGCELGCPLLPPIECTGSSVVSFIRATDEFFGLNIMCKSGFQSMFTLNGSSTLIPASAFAVVPGTGGLYVSAQVSFTIAEVPVGTGSQIANSGGLFHVGLINGGASTGARYGYFSDYGKLSLGPDLDLCYGDTVLLDASMASGPYNWSSGQSTALITVDTAGIYSVSANQGTGCPLTDTVIVSIIGAVPFVDLGPDTLVCSDNIVMFEVIPNPYINISWAGLINNTIPVSGTGPTFSVDKPGTYSVEADGGNCGYDTDTIIVMYNDLGLELGNNISNVCITNPVTLDATTPLLGYPSVSYHWSNNLTTPTLVAYSSGNYSVTVTRGQCSEIDTINVSYLNPLTVNLGADTLICQNSQIALSGGNFQNASYLWSTGSNNTTVTVSQPGTYSLTVTNACGSYTDSKVVGLIYPPVVDLGTDEVICQGGGIMLQSNYPGAVNIWSTGENAPAIYASQQGIYSVTVTNSCGTSNDDIYLQVDQPLVFDLGPDTFVCAGFVLDPGITAQSFFWSTGSTNSYIFIQNSDTYSLEAENSCGIFSDIIEINVISIEVDLGADTTICPGQSVTIDPGFVQNGYFSWSTGAFNQTISVSSEGLYIVTITNPCETFSDSILVSVFEPSLNIGNDTIICPGDTIILDAGHPGSTYSWSTGETTQIIQTNNEGIFFVNLSHVCGNLTDSIDILFFSVPQIDLGDDTIFMSSGIPFILDAGPGFISFDWSSGQNTQTINVNTEGIYSVVGIDENGCQSVDSVVVLWKTQIDEISSGILIYPNPASSYIEIISKDEMIKNVEFYDNIGQLLFIREIQTYNTTIHTEKFNQGFYWIKIKLQNGEEIIRRVVLIF